MFSGTIRSVVIFAVVAACPTRIFEQSSRTLIATQMGEERTFLFYRLHRECATYRVYKTVDVSRTTTVFSVSFTG